MAFISNIPDIVGNTMSDKVLFLNEMTDFSSDTEIAKAVKSSLDAVEYMRSDKEIMNSTFIKTNTKNTKSAKARWIAEVAEVASLKHAILKGQFGSHPLAIEYKLHMEASPKSRAVATITHLFTALKDLNGTFTPKGALLTAICAAYSYHGEGSQDPLAAECWVVTSKSKRIDLSALIYRRYGPGTGIGIQQWSFDRHDDLIANLNVWSANLKDNPMGSLLPSPKAQYMFAVRELLYNNKTFVSMVNEPSTDINKALAHFLHIQLGSAYKGSCIKLHLKGRLNMNEFNILSGDLRADYDSVMKYANSIKPNGQSCPY